MSLKYINIDMFSILQKTVKGLTDLNMSLYDVKGTMLSDAPAQDPVLSVLTSSEAGFQEYISFIINTIKTAVLRKDITIAKGPTGQYYFFFPCNIRNISVVLVGGAVYLSSADFNEFIAKMSEQYLFSPVQIEQLQENIIVMDIEKFKAVSSHIGKISYTSMKSAFEENLLQKRSRRIKTFLTFFSNIESDTDEKTIYSLMADMLMYHFSIDALSFMVSDDRVFRTVIATGRGKEFLYNIVFEKDSWVVSRILKENCPVLFDDPIDIHNLKLEDNIDSVYIFPLMSGNGEDRLLCLYNSMLDEGDAQEIFDICKYYNFVVNSINIQNYYSKKMHEMTLLFFATSGINLSYDRPEDFYNSILETAVRLTNAERGSLMLAENGDGELSVKAVHGINKWIVKDLRIRPGEGIAGKVFRESVPIISKDIEKEFSLRKKSNYKTPSFMSIPLKVGEETIGVLNISDKISGEVFREDDLALIRYFANYASIALKGSTYYTLAEQMKELSILDPLTELFNRRYFQERLAEEIDRSERYGLTFSLAMIDIDDFKLFNDTEGHPAGDDILIRLSRIVHGSLRTTDVLSRIGGEEFAVLMPQTEKDEAFHVLERIRNAVKQKLERTWKSYPRDNITISIGIASFPEDDKNARKLIWKADKALYRSKMHGKDRIFVWEEPSSL